MLKTILFDLDGTLLPMNQDAFAKAYLYAMGKYMLPYGYDPQQLANTMWKGMDAMYANDGSKTNEKVFWDGMVSTYGKNVLDDIKYFNQFYMDIFDSVKTSCGYNPLSKQVIDELKNTYSLILATNPLFPSIATEKRIEWAGLCKEDFELVTTYENSSSSKPNLLYYQSILEQFNLCPEECLMVGNDVLEDMCAKELGMHVFLVTDCLLHAEDVDIDVYPHGSLEDLLEYIKKIEKD